MRQPIRETTSIKLSPSIWRLLGSALAMLLVPSSSGAASTCYGTTSSGRLEGGCQLQLRGPNFEPYSDHGVALGRTHVHCTVAEIVADAYARVAKELPAARFVYGETGYSAGGPLPPHKTHQNGLSVDFFVPTRTSALQPARVPAPEENRWGYDVEFDSDGKSGELAIDFEAISVHLLALKEAAHARDVGIRKIFFDVPLRKHLESTAAWPRIRDLPFSTTEGWWRHDEHYHVDFEIPCRPL